jgi:hypothetical protein
VPTRSHLKKLGTLEQRGQVIDLQSKMLFQVVGTSWNKIKKVGTNFFVDGKKRPCYAA